jgi:hypothetical protein
MRREDQRRLQEEAVAGWERRKTTQACSQLRRRQANRRKPKWAARIVKCERSTTCRLSHAAGQKTSTTGDNKAIITS